MKAQRNAQTNGVHSSVSEDFTEAGGAQGLYEIFSGPAVEEQTGEESITEPAVEQATNEVIINSLPKGLEIDPL